MEAEALVIEDPNEKLKDLIAKMALKSNYWGYLFARVRRVSSYNMTAIMGVRPHRNGIVELYFHPGKVANTSDGVLRQIIEHEGMHILQKHIPRLLRILGNEVDPFMKFIKSKIFNIAADCAVNPVMKFPRNPIINGKPFQPCFPDLYGLPDAKSTEFYFNELMKADEDGSEGDDGEGALGGAGEEYDVIGDHSEWTRITKEVTDLSSLSRIIDSYVQEIIKDSAKAFSKKRGNLPSYVKQLIDKALEPPKVPYYQIIRKLVKGSRYSKFKRAFTKINRKRTYVFCIGDKNVPQISPFPGRTRDFTFNIVTLIDTSGSMTPDDIKEGLSGCKNIIEKDRHCKLTVLENDARLQKEYVIKRVSDIDFEVKGRGGTVLRPGLERAKELNPDVCLVFTDGVCDNINSMSRKLIPRKLIWVIQKDGTADRVYKTGFVVRI